MTAAQQRKETHEEDPLEQPERGAARSAAHTWGRPRSPAAEAEGETAEGGWPRSDGVPNGSRPLASTPSVLREAACRRMLSTPTCGIYLASG